jgi:hypothetical protein
MYIAHSLTSASCKVSELLDARCLRLCRSGETSFQPALKLPSIVESVESSKRRSSTNIMATRILPTRLVPIVRSLSPIASRGTLACPQRQWQHPQWRQFSISTRCMSFAHSFTSFQSTNSPFQYYQTKSTPKTTNGSLSPQTARPPRWASPNTPPKRSATSSSSSCRRRALKSGTETRLARWRVSRARARS